MGEVIIENLGNNFDLLGQIRKIKLPPPSIEEHIVLEIEARQLVNSEIISKRQFP